MRRWLRVATLPLLALLGLAGTARAGEPEPVDAELLRDLDLLGSPDYARDREIAKRMPLLQRLRMLEALRAMESPVPNEASTRRAAPPSKEVK